MFRFKQFTVHQQNSAMKVCTDACLFGALINGPSTKLNALDIGTGTGLLSLMVAQRFSKWNIDAVELDEQAILDATKNVVESPFKDNINLVLQSIQEYNLYSGKKYDIIFTNPPFYQNQLKSTDRSKNIAHHSSELSFYDLAKCIQNLLSEKGRVWILLPPFEMKQFSKELAEHKLYPIKSINVRHNEQKPVFRNVTVFSRTLAETIEETEILIYENDKYSTIFTEFLRDYYLIF
jgi:tRNA1Val (adenine37-N6)-methyltransferase